MNLVQEYLMLATDIVSFAEYDKKKFVKEYNRKATQMYKIAILIEQNFPDLKIEFCELLYHENTRVRLWVAHHILEVMNCDESHRRVALREIRYYAETDKTANGFGEKLWLDDWYQTHPMDKLI